VAASTARVFGAAVGLLWIEHGQRSSFALHMEDAIPRGSPLRVADRWQPVRALIANLPVYVPDVSEHRAFSASPLLPSGAPATLIGVPLRLGARTAGAVAIVQPHVVGHLGRGMLEPLVFWAQRLAGDLLGLDASAPTRGLPVSPPLPQAIPLSQAVESIAAVLDVALLASDETGVVCYANPALLALIGAARRDVLGHKRAIVLRRLASAAGAQDGVVSAIVGATTTGIPSDFTVEKPRSAVLRWRARPLPLPGDTTGTLDEFADVTREFERARARETLVRVDAATRLPNRTGIDDALGVEVARSLRTGEPFCVAMFALDQPHRAAAGDELFRQVAWLLRSTARRHDVVGRLDGLRLVAILTNTRADQALALCERFGTAVRELDVQGCRTTASAGVAQFDAGKTIRDVLDEATAHLSAARRLGGDRALAEIRQTAG
jgi:diguanylate cyclase (GGDEF)-like protein